MSATPPMPTLPEPTPTEPAVPTRSRRRLVIRIAAGVLALAVIAVVAGLTLNAANAHAVVRYDSKAEHYSVKAPGAPTQTHGNIAGVIPTTFTHWAAGDLYYSVSSSLGGFPPSLRGEFLHDALVDGLKHAPGVTASSLKSKVVDDAFLAQPDEIKVSGALGYEFTLRVKGAPHPFHVVFTGHGTLLYMLVFSDTSDSRDKDFLKSFTFVG